MKSKKWVRKFDWVTFFLLPVVIVVGAWGGVIFWYGCLWENVVEEVDDED